jgi:hypothetical protein
LAAIGVSGIKIVQLDLQMANRSATYWLTRPAEIDHEHEHEHEMVHAQDVGFKPPNSMNSSDPGRMFERGRSRATGMNFMGDSYRDFSNFRVVADDRIV